MKLQNHLLAISVIPLLFACGGSDSGESPSGNEPQPTSTGFSLAVSDAPIDSAVAVVVYFDQIELIGNGETVSFDVTDENGDPRQIDLLSLQGENFATLVEDEEIPLGEYGQLRVVVTQDSYIEMEQGTFELRVPSNELKLDGFIAEANVTAAYTLEFDLRKSLVDPVGQAHIFLKPRGVRLVANQNVGTIEGVVDESLIMDASCADKVDPDKGNAVYLYQEADLEMAVLGDDTDEPANENEISPYTIAEVEFDEQNAEYRYQAAFVAQGDYTLAFTCQAALDQPETDENAEDGFVFLSSKSATVEAEQTAEVDFP
ncbi:DUF4382 domain-containing protein [Lacimicrobium alkaliphilum]|uniref:DUF4382 domain-containing protein n=1 Tax=Lacimicrobium alkaliphilum TaxID=1526571 RepID=A0A0U2RJK9_9ALTE|nr:DUF4382 domain-containing protein [Lacimicrobium alkaliphilum]ALS97434.1 hypothetical protein AT746_03530 [Lacimicrobium alkaliphilum]